MESIEDLPLVQQACAGDAAAKRELVARLAFIRARLHIRNRALGFPLSNSDLDDIEQDVFLRVFQSLSHFRGHSSLRTWVGRMCDFALIDMLRQLHRAARTDWVDSRDVSGSIDECQSERAALRGALESLAREGPNPDLRLVMLHARDGQSFESIAAEERTTPGAIKARYYRVLVRLRAQLEQH